MKFAKGLFYEKFAAVNEQICFFFLLVTMKAAPHPFSIRSLLEREALAACGHSMGEAMLQFLGRPLRPKRPRSHREAVSSQPS